MEQACYTFGKTIYNYTYNYHAYNGYNQDYPQYNKSVTSTDDHILHSRSWLGIGDQ